MAFLSRGFKNLQWYSLTKHEPLVPKGSGFFIALSGNCCGLSKSVGKEPDRVSGMEDLNCLAKRSESFGNIG